MSAFDGRRRVYPRVCGGTIDSLLGLLYVQGLSPRVRGNLQPHHRARTGRRSIPACAGEPPIDTASPIAAPVYPRVCGGTAIRSQLNGYMCGLSPRVRGNPLDELPDGAREGSIPACAGEPCCDRA